MIYFHDLTQERAQELFIIGGLKIVKMWVIGDVREGREGERWMNILSQK